MEQPADRTSLQQYDVDADVLSRWRETRAKYLKARTALIRQIERQGWRATPRPHDDGGFVDIVFDGPPDPEAPRFVEVENDRGRSIQYGEWIKSEWIDRGDGHWVLRVPTGALFSAVRHAARWSSCYDGCRSRRWRGDRGWPRGAD